MVKRQPNTHGGLVFSTAEGKLCPRCGHKVDECICRELADSVVPSGDGIVRLKRETKGRKGAGVTLITGICLNNPELKALAKELKKKCGSGGAVKDGTIELQGNVREQVQVILEKKGFKVKICGG